MDRRNFIARSFVAALAPILRSQSSPAEGSPKRARRATRTVREIDRVSLDRREYLAANPDGLSVEDLNTRIPQIDAIELINEVSEAPEANELRVIAWNMERGRHWSDGVKLINAHEALKAPAFIFLGEMDHGMARSANEHTAREMALALGMNYAYGVEFLELTRGEEREREQYPGENEWGYHGNAILSRYPLGNVRMLRFPGIEKWYGHYQHRLGGRMALFADVRVGQTTVTLCSTHLESGPTDNAARTEQGRMILDELREHAASAPVLLGGDFNAAPNQQVIRDLKDAGFAIDEANRLEEFTVQRVVDGMVRLYGLHIDYLAVRGVRIIRDETSPAVIPAVYPPGPEGKMLGDHAVVTAKVQVT